MVNNLRMEYSSYLQIFTDGSKIGEYTGCAIYIPSKNYELKIKLDSILTVFTSEAIAILNALEYIKRNKIGQAVIFSDSLSVLQSLKSTTAGSYSNINGYILHIFCLLCSLYKEQVIVNFIWVEAYVGISYNEQVDKLAKEGAISGRKLQYKICLSDILNYTRTHLFNKWSEYYRQFKNDHPNNRYTQIEDNINKYPWFQNIGERRNLITTVSRLRFGHACFPQHLKRIGVVDTDMCISCGVPCDLDHIFFGCSCYIRTTNDFINRLLELKISLPTNLLHLLSLKNIHIYKELVRFLSNTNQRL